MRFGDDSKIQKGMRVVGVTLPYWKRTGTAVADEEVTGFEERAVLVLWDGNHQKPELVRRSDVTATGSV